MKSMLLKKCVMKCFFLKNKETKVKWKLITATQIEILINHMHQNYHHVYFIPLARARGYNKRRLGKNSSNSLNSSTQYKHGLNLEAKKERKI